MLCCACLDYQAGRDLKFLQHSPLPVQAWSNSSSCPPCFPNLENKSMICSLFIHFTSPPWKDWKDVVLFLYHGLAESLSAINSAISQPQCCELWVLKSVRFGEFCTPISLWTSAESIILGKWIFRRRPESLLEAPCGLEEMWVWKTLNTSRLPGTSPQSSNHYIMQYYKMK